MSIPIPHTTMEGPRIRLRSIVSEDLLIIFKGLSDPDIIRYYGVSYTDENSTRDQMRWYNSIETEHSGKWWIIEERESRQPLGAIGFNHWLHQHEKAELGYWLYPTAQGKGIASEALELVCHEAFSHLHMHRLEAYIEEPNHSSVRLLEKAGFVKEGLLRECEWKNGKWISLYIFSRLNPNHI